MDVDQMKALALVLEYGAGNAKIDVVWDEP